MAKDPAFSLLHPQDTYLFNEGTHSRLYLRLGAHHISTPERQGTYFAVWAPDARSVSVIGDFNGWDKKANPLHAHDKSGIWEAFVQGAELGQLYKFHIDSRYGRHHQDKSDPFAFSCEIAPSTASRITSLEYEWADQDWMSTRHAHNALNAPHSVYEVHLGSWMRVPEEEDRWLTYREVAPKLAAYVKDLGFTHVELMPIMEHPFYGSWGYQVTGYFAPTSRYGTPQDLMFLVDHLHQQGIGVILDWVPSHFPYDAHGLAYFDGTHLYEHADPKQGFHPDWGSAIFNYGRNEVRSFLLSSATFWLDKYHVDGLRVDAVASMLYLDYSREDGAWIPNQYGGNENIEAITFLRQLNTAVYGNFPDCQTVAEESTAWPMISRPVYVGGMGFGMKWDMGWMHDTLRYMSKDALFRKYHHGELTFRMIYAFSENFVLSLSHDEVVHGKGSLIGKMPGDEWQKFANLRLLYAYMYAQPGKKLLFMGNELAQRSEWNHERSLDWHLLQHAPHDGIRQCVRDLNHVYAVEPALHTTDFDPHGFEWIDANDSEQSVISFLRKTKTGSELILAVLNFTPIPRHDYRVGVPVRSQWKEIFNSDRTQYGGSGLTNGAISTLDEPKHGRPYSLSLTLPPLGAVLLKRQDEG